MHAVHVEPGGVIGPHPAGFDQLFLVVQGSGWVAGADGLRIDVGMQHGAFVSRGDVHSKGSETGMVALKVQADRFSLTGCP